MTLPSSWNNTLESWNYDTDRLNSDLSDQLKQRKQKRTIAFTVLAVLVLAVCIVTVVMLATKYTPVLKS